MMVNDERPSRNLPGRLGDRPRDRGLPTALAQLSQGLFPIHPDIYPTLALNSPSPRFLALQTVLLQPQCILQRSVPLSLQFLPPNSHFFLLSQSPKTLSPKPEIQPPPAKAANPSSPSSPPRPPPRGTSSPRSFPASNTPAGGSSRWRSPVGPRVGAAVSSSSP